ncbi:type IV secretion system protein [Crenobacter sp. SG2305]|uniref:type IV secretion system protein n=1 Tax=Crenobacter oryzisoli TaxID=3056844 RepID=UPI0025AAF5F5|nr:type IV secretion system protein [Crenobacter sp. SG2305]MDN0082483.1 type IV secretion system protein [Crenobacter sp. SG2305]
MFAWKKKSAGPTVRPEVPNAAPPVAYSQDLKNMRAWFERYGHHYVERNRYATLAVLMTGVSVALAGGILTMLPLKTVAPYVITVDNTSGRPDAQLATAQAYKPGEKEVQYFLARFASLMWEIDKYKSQQNLVEAASMSVDEGAAKLNGWINDSNIFGRLRDNGTLTRTVTISSVTQLQDGAAIVRLTTVERALNVPESTKKWLLTLHYKTIAPTTEAQILKNPLGLYINNLTIQEDLG